MRLAFVIICLGFLLIGWGLWTPVPPQEDDRRGRPDMSTELNLHYAVLVTGIVALGCGLVLRVFWPRPRGPEPDLD